MKEICTDEQTEENDANFSGVHCSNFLNNLLFVQKLIIVYDFQYRIINQ
jgi:hypothetical protein